MAAALVFSITAQGAQAPWTLDAVLKQLDHEAGEFRSLTADVERTKVTVVVNDRSTESGEMQVRRDGKMRIDLTAPDPQTILRDGDHLYIYTTKIHREEEYDLGKHRALIDEFVLLGFGTSGQDLKKGYLVTLQGEETCWMERRWFAWSLRRRRKMCATKSPRLSCGLMKLPGCRRSSSFMKMVRRIILSSVTPTLCGA